MSAQGQARQSDVESIDSIITAAYEVISGEAGEKRDWDRLRSLFAPGARLIPTGKDAGVRLPDEQTPEPLSVESYIARVEGYFQTNGFYEIGACPPVDGLAVARNLELGTWNFSGAIVSSAAADDLATALPVHQSHLSHRESFDAAPSHLLNAPFSRIDFIWLGPLALARGIGTFQSIQILGIPELQSSGQS